MFCEDDVTDKPGKKVRSHIGIGKSLFVKEKKKPRIVLLCRKNCCWLIGDTQWCAHTTPPHKASQLGVGWRSLALLNEEPASRGKGAQYPGQQPLLSHEKRGLFSLTINIIGGDESISLKKKRNTAMSIEEIEPSPAVEHMRGEIAGGHAK